MDTTRPSGHRRPQGRPAGAWPARDRPPGRRPPGPRRGPESFERVRRSRALSKSGIQRSIASASTGLWRRSRRTDWPSASSSATGCCVGSATGMLSSSPHRVSALRRDHRAGHSPLRAPRGGPRGGLRRARRPAPPGPTRHLYPVRVVDGLSRGPHTRYPIMWWPTAMGWAWTEVSVGWRGR